MSRSKELQATLEDIERVAQSETTGQPDALYLDGTMQLQEEELQSLRQNREQRNTYAWKAFRFMLCWSAGFGVAVVFTGFGWWTFSTAEWSVIGTSTGAVIGLVGYILRGLFAVPK